MERPLCFIDSRLPGLGKQKSSSSRVWGCSRLTYLVNIRFLAAPPHPASLRAVCFLPHDTGRTASRDQWNVSRDASSKRLEMCLCIRTWCFAEFQKTSISVSKKDVLIVVCYRVLRWFACCCDRSWQIHTDAGLKIFFGRWPGCLNVLGGIINLVFDRTDLKASFVSLGTDQLFRMESSGVLTVQIWKKVLVDPGSLLVCWSPVFPQWWKGQWRHKDGLCNCGKSLLKCHFVFSSKLKGIWRRPDPSFK